VGGLLVKGFLFTLLFADALPHRLFRDGFPMLELPKHSIFESGFTGFIG
jgi:hypothetical protein